MRSLVVLFVFVLSISKAVVSKPVVPDCNCEACKDVFDNFSACAGFIEGECDDPSPTCCQNLATLNKIAKQEDGGTVRICRCIEYFAMYKAHHPFMASRTHDLPLKCHTRKSFPISESMDCSRINQ